MTFIKLDKITKFELNNAHTFRVVKNRYGGFLIPVEIDDDEGTYRKVFQLFVDHHACNKIYGTQLYLKTKKLSAENKEKLLNKGNQDILIHFETTGIYTRSGEKYLIFEVTKLCKLPESEPNEVSQNEVEPERSGGERSEQE